VGGEVVHRQAGGLGEPEVVGKGQHVLDVDGATSRPADIPNPATRSPAADGRPSGASRTTPASSEPSVNGRSGLYW
jgi:hypothetical protein